MRVLLLRPPSTFEGISNARKSQMSSIGLPLSLLYMAAVLNKNGHEVRIYDSLIETKGTIDTRIGFQIGSWEGIKKAIEDYSPDIVGINNQFTEQKSNAVEVARIAKDVDKNITTVVGGNHATVRPEDFLEKYSGIDIACRREGELTLLDIANGKKLSDINGISYVQDSRIVHNPNREWISVLDSLPFPAYGLINMESYFGAVKRGFDTRPDQLASSHRQVSLITSRGCPYNCVFCSIRLHMGRQWRANSADYVLNHLEHLVKAYGVEHVHFEDDNMTASPERVDEIMDGMKDRNIDITFDTPNGVRLDTLNYNLLKKMKERGLIQLRIAIESGNQETLDKIIRKGHRLEDAVKVAKWCKMLKISLSSFYVIGFPGETKQAIKKSLNFAMNLWKKYNVIPHVGIALCYPETDLYRICKEKGYIEAEAWQRGVEFGLFGQASIRTPEFSPKWIRNELKRFYRKAALWSLIGTTKNPKTYIDLPMFIFRNPVFIKRAISALGGYIT